MGSPPSMRLEAPAHSPKPIAPTLSNGRKLLPLPSPLHSPPGRHLSYCSCSAQLLLLFTQHRLAACARRTLWIITHTWACLDAHTHAHTCTDTSWYFFQDIINEGVGIGLKFFDFCCAEINLVKGSFFIFFCLQWITRCSAACEAPTLLPRPCTRPSPCTAAPITFQLTLTSRPLPRPPLPPAWLAVTRVMTGFMEGMGTSADPWLPSNITL